MNKLVILLTTDARVRQCEQANNPIEITPADLGSKSAEGYGYVWARLWKDDIVMLVEEGE